MIKRLSKYLLFAGLFFLCSCNPDPEPIKYGHDNCEHCKMLISDHNYGAELITQKGKIFKYDSIECLADDQIRLSNEEIHSIWVANFYPPNELININNAHFLLSDNLKSPMGLYLSAFKNDVELNKIAEKYGGKEISWEDLLDYVNKKWN
jgi:copper chaperone NosL